MGDSLWKNLIEIYFSIKRIVHNSQNFIEKLFFQNEDNNFIIEEPSQTFNIRTIEYVQSFFDKISELLEPTEKNISVLGSSSIYAKIFINIYLYLINLQVEFQIMLPQFLTIWRNLIEVIDSIEGNKAETVYKSLAEKLATQYENRFICLDDFCEVYKNKLGIENKNKVSRFQALVLFRLA